MYNIVLGMDMVFLQFDLSFGEKPEDSRVPYKTLIHTIFHLTCRFAIATKRSPNIIMSDNSTWNFDEEEKEEKDKEDGEDEEDEEDKEDGEDKEDEEDEEDENEKDKEGEGNDRKDDTHGNLDPEKMRTARQVCDPMSYQGLSVFHPSHPFSQIFSTIGGEDIFVYPTANVTCVLCKTKRALLTIYSHYWKGHRDECSYLDCFNALKLENSQTNFSAR